MVQTASTKHGLAIRKFRNIDGGMVHFSIHGQQAYIFGSVVVRTLGSHREDLSLNPLSVGDRMGSFS